MLVSVVKNLQVINKTNHKVDKINLHKLVHSLQSILNFEVSSLLINFISDSETSELNSKYLKHHNSTDIITFDYSGKKNILDAELFICPDVAVQNAKFFHVTFREEILRLVIHGILHLLEYDDKNKKDKIKMKKEENRLVNETKLLLGR